MEKWTAPHLAPLCTAAAACDASILHPVRPGRRRRLDPVPSLPDPAVDAALTQPPMPPQAIPQPGCRRRSKLAPDLASSLSLCTGLQATSGHIHQACVLLH